MGVIDWIRVFHGMTPKSIIATLPKIIQGKLSSKSEILFHYTTPEALLSILKDGQLWSSNIRFLNDTKEVDYADDIVREVMKQKLDGNGDKSKKKFLILLKPRRSGGHSNPGRPSAISTSPFGKRTRAVSTLAPDSATSTRCRDSLTSRLQRMIRLLPWIVPMAKQQRAT